MPSNNASKRGFASMDPERQREIASKGGKAAHEKGTAHEWTPEEAKVFGEKGGKSSHGKGSSEQQRDEQGQFTSDE